MPPAAPHAPNRTLAGILFMLAASSLFPVMNGLVQILSARYGTEQIVWARAASHLVFIAALFAPRFGVALVRTAAPKWQIVRSMVHLASMICFFTGVKYLPLANAASISFTAPFFVALLAWPMLGERITPRRLLAIVVAFLGVLIVIRPGSAVFQWASLYMLGSAICYALYQILTRRVAQHDAAETSAVYSALVGTVVMGILAPFVWTPIASWSDACLLFSLGILGGLGHYFVARAMVYAQASIIAPFGYWQLIGSVFVGYLISGHLPDQFTWIGAGIIVCAGVYIAWCETRERPAAVGVQRA
ncbi:MAG: DMT family transporter [Hyphomonadaceae bacterium]|nr:DMT family transporter [Hyphomonadaceae bacterium]